MGERTVKAAAVSAGARCLALRHGAPAAGSVWRTVSPDSRWPRCFSAASAAGRVSGEGQGRRGGGGSMRGGGGRR